MQINGQMQKLKMEVTGYGYQDMNIKLQIQEHQRPQKYILNLLVLLKQHQIQIMTIFTLHLQMEKKMILKMVNGMKKYQAFGYPNI